MEKKGRGKKHRICAAFLCVCMLFSLPGISDIFPVVAAAEQDESFQKENIIMAFDPLPEDIKEQTVFIGTDLDELEFPKELTVCLARESSEQETGEREQENIGETDKIEGNSDTETEGELNIQSEETEVSEETTVAANEETDAEDEDNEKESVSFEEQEESNSGLSSEESEENDTAGETHTVTMPEYYAENVISVQTLENTQTENQEETVMIDGVTWQSEPEYNGSAEGTYVFTAVLPDGYALAEGVSLPQITVTVKENESGTDTVIQTLLDRITALPDAEEYLATEPDMEEDEEAYTEWEEKLHEYAEEALAIWEEYEALTEEQQAQMPEEELAKLTVWVEIAGNLSNIEDVVVVSQKETHSHDGNTYVELQPNNLTLTNGTYYLSNDLDMNTITIEGDVTLCLNGRSLTHSGDTGSVIVVNSGTFTLCDCKDNAGRITGGKGEEDYGGGIFVCSNARFIMLGGTICGNAAKYGGGISIGVGNNNAANTSFTMSGGVIEGNAAESQGGGVFCGATCEMTITNGVIKNNTAESRGGGIFSGTTSKVNLLANAELDKVLVFGNKVGSNGNGGGYAGLGLGNAASTVKIEGNVNITGNKKNNDENNIALLNRQVILLTKKLTGSFGVTAWLEPYSSSNQDVNKPYISTVQGADGYEVSPQDFAHINSDNTLYSVLMIEGNIVNAANGEKGKVLVLGNESTGNLSDMALSIKDGSSGDEIKLSPDFAETTYEYAVTVPNSVKVVSIEATPKNAGADVAMTIQNADNATDITVAADNIPLAEGENAIKVKVTEGDASKVYIIIITREEVKGNPVTITSYKDGVEWTGAPSGYRLTSDDGKTFLPGLVAPDGTYKIYIGDIDTGVEVTVAGAEVTARVDYYTVTFYDGNTELPAPSQQIVLKGTAASAPADNPTKTGYTFSKWVTADGSSMEYDFANETVTEKTSVYAGWTPVTYTITYDLAGGTLPAGKTNPADYTIETTEFTLQNPERTGYTFAGWSGTGLAANSTIVTISKGSTGNREYTANWTAKTYGITLNGNGGTGDDLTGYTYGQGAVMPANWTKTGYAFAGWYNNKDCTGTPVTEVSATDTGDKTFWAKWTPQTYQVIFDYHGADGGDTTASKNVTYNSKYGTFPTPSRTGYTFKGWYTAEAGGSEVNADTVVRETSAHTLHARWKDETPPDKPVLQNGVTLPAGWTKDQTTIPLKLYDGVGVTELWVSIDGKDYIKVDGFSGGTGSMTYDYTPVLEGESEPGKGHTYQFKAVDAAGNFSESDTFTVKLDQTPPVFGTITYENKVTTLWNWIIGKKSMVIHVPVTDTGSGVTEIRYTLTPKDAAGNLDTSQAVEKTAAVRDGEAKITFDKDFRGIIAISCTDVAGNPAADVTIDTAGKGGVIVEDHAPDITILADRNPADLQQTQQNGVAVSEEYYDSAPALLVTVKDDAGNAITAGIATVTYQVEGSEDETVTVDGSALQEQVSFTIPAAQISTGVTEIKVTTTDNAGNTAEKIITLKVKGPEKEPAAKIDYRQEKLTGLVPGGEYLIDGETCTADQEGHIQIKEGWIDSNLNIIKKGNGSETSDSTAQNLSVPARPAAPNAPELNTRTENSITLKTITGAQYRRTDGTGNWQDSTAFEGLNPKTAYSFRAYYPATDTGFASRESGETRIGTVPTPPTPDQLGIDYEAETLAPTSDIEAFSDQGCTTPVTAGSVEDYMGQTIYFRYPVSGIFPESRTTAVTIPERPATPVPGAADASYPGAMNGAITGLSDGTVYEYRKQNDDGTWEDNWTSAAVADGQIGGLGKGTYEVRVKAVDTVSFRSEAAAVSISEKPAAKLDTPDIRINYTEETLTGFKPGEEYIISGKPAAVSADGTIKIDESQLGTTLSIMCKGNGQDKLDSDVQSLPIPTRPAKPTPTGVDVSTAGGTGKLTGLTANVTYEVSTDGGKTWVSGTANGSGEIIGLEPGTYTVRVKVGASNFASEPSEPAVIGAYQIKVTFMVDGQKYIEVSVDYGMSLTDIPPVPVKENAVGAWCIDEQGTTPAVFTNITADMTVYAVYTTAYTVTLQTGTGYTLSAEAGSQSPVKEGGSFTFRFTLGNGYQKTADFAVTVNGAKVELTNDTYTITDIRADQTVAVAGVKKKANNPPSGGGDNNGDDGGGSEPTPTPPPTQPPTETTTPMPTPQPTPTLGTTPPVTENEPEGRKPETTPEPENNETQPPSEPSQTQTPDTTPESQTYAVGKGAVIVTLNNVDETVCTARVADAVAVAHAVLSEEELAVAEQGQTIEIRIDVEHLEAVPQEDAEVIVTGIEDCQEQIPGLVMGMYVDISMYMRIGSGDWNAIHATNEPVVIILDIPDELAGLTADFYIMRAHEGEYLLMEDLDEAPETITIQTEAFSTYAILYQMQEGGEKKPAAKCSLCHICPTFLGICYFIWLAIIIALALVIYLIIRRKHKEEESEEQ